MYDFLTVFISVALKGFYDDIILKEVQAVAYKVILNTF